MERQRPPRRRRRPPPPPLPPPGTTQLAGHPEQPFLVRFNLTYAGTDELLDYVSMVCTLLGIPRWWPVLYPAARAWLLAHLLLPIVNLGWRRAALAAHPADGGSWARWRELLAACVRASAFGGGVSWRLMLMTFDQEEAGEALRAGRAARGVLPAAINLANHSTAPLLALLFLKPMRLGWAIPLQLCAWLADCTPYTKRVCSHPRMTPRVLHPLLRRVSQALALATLGLHPMVPPVHATAGDPAADCHAVMAFLQTAGFMAAALFKARQEARLWVQHQAQRRALGLPLEGGYHAAVYAGVLALAAVSQPAAAPLLSLALLLVVWQAVMVLGGAG